MATEREAAAQTALEQAFMEARGRMPAGRQSVLNVGPMVTEVLDAIDLADVPATISLRDWGAR